MTHPPLNPKKMGHAVRAFTEAHTPTKPAPPISGGGRRSGGLRLAPAIGGPC